MSEKPWTILKDGESLDDLVLIYVGDGHCYWRENGCGYTNHYYAGVYTRADAIARTHHCGPEKKVELHSVPPDHIPTLQNKIRILEEQLNKFLAAPNNTDAANQQNQTN